MCDRGEFSDTDLTDLLKVTFPYFNQNNEKCKEIMAKSKPVLDESMHKIISSSLLDSEKDIKECARAFTGYHYNFEGGFRFIQLWHDYDEKEFLGRSGTFDGDDIIDLILEQKQCARYICEKIYRYFVNEELDE